MIYKSIEKRHTDTEPSAYPIEYQLDSVIWHTHHGPISAEAVPAVYAALDLIGSRLPNSTPSKTLRY